MTKFKTLLAGIGLLTGVLQASPRPNILFCLADDWGWPHAGAYGDPVVKTPAFDRLAAEGVLFEHAYVSSPSCTPCRNAILTGQAFYRLGPGANLWSTLDVRHPNFMFLLRQSGYAIGHWRKAWGPGDFKTGGYREHPCGPASNFPDFLKRRQEGQPFCFWFGTSDPHRPFKRGSGQAAGMDLSRIRIPAFYPDDTQVRMDIADYYWEVQRWDRDVAAALALLEAAGELDNTIVVMTGDHGMPFPRCKGNLYDWGVRVPLALRWGDRVTARRRVTDFVSLVDLAPTFLEAAGVDIPGDMTGRSLLPILAARGSGRIDPDRDHVLFGRERHTPAQAMPSLAGYPARGLRTDRWLLILNLEPDRWPAGVPEGGTHPIGRFADCDGGLTKSLLSQQTPGEQTTHHYDLCFAKRPALELYDCRADPDQVQNLAADPRHQQTIQRLRAQLTAELKRTGDPRYTEDPVEFDRYPYGGKYLDAHLKKHGY